MEKDTYYRKIFAESNFSLCETPEGFPKIGDCFSFSKECGGGYYWYYEAPGQYNIKIHDFWFNEDTILNMNIPKCLSVTYYESISGEELIPYRKMNCNVVKSFFGGEEPYRALIHRNVPIRSIGIEYRPEFFEKVLSDYFKDRYKGAYEAFKSIDETTDFPEMKKLLKDLKAYSGDKMATSLYFDAKAMEALSLVFMHHQKINAESKAEIMEADRKMLDSLSYYINDHFADNLTIESLARIACMGTTKLKKSFKSYFGCTVADYITKVRIDHAEHLLLYTELSIGEVAKAVGYTVSGHFAGVFQNIKGLLPSEYRKAFRR